MVIVDDLAWPIFVAFFDKLWGPVTGGVLMLTGSILITTTIITRMTAKGKTTTYLAAQTNALSVAGPRLLTVGFTATAIRRCLGPNLDQWTF